MTGGIAKGIIKIIIEGVAYDLIKSGAQWLFRDPPPPGKRPPVIWWEGRVFHLQPNGNYEMAPVSQI
jgi:hypothetical protein